MTILQRTGIQALGHKIIENKSTMIGEGKCILSVYTSVQDLSFFQEHRNSAFTSLLEGLAGIKGETIDSDGNVTPEIL